MWKLCRAKLTHVSELHSCPAFQMLDSIPADVYLVKRQPCQRQWCEFGFLILRKEDKDRTLVGKYVHHQIPFPNRAVVCSSLVST